MAKYWEEENDENMNRCALEKQYCVLLFFCSFVGWKFNFTSLFAIAIQVILKLLRFPQGTLVSLEVSSRLQLGIDLNGSEVRGL